MTGVYRPSDTVIAREVGGEEVLLDMESGLYFGLNPVGTAIWQALEGDGAAVHQIVEAVVAGFEVDEAAARRDVVRLIGELSAKGLVVED